MATFRIRRGLRNSDPNPQINRSLSQSLDLAALPAGLRDVRLRVTDGQITISGVAQPSS